MRETADGGVRLNISIPTPIAPEFNLRVGAGTTWRVALAWQLRDEIGVRFLFRLDRKPAKSFGLRGRGGEIAI